MPKHDILEIEDFLSVVVKGKLDVPYFQQITDDILKACKEKNIRKVIMDVSDTKKPYSDSEKLEFASYASATLKEAVDQYAYVYPKELITYTPQVISQGSGFNVRGFTSLDDALTWIEGKH